MSDLIDRQAAIDATEKFIKDCNPEHFVGHPNFIEYMDSVGIQSFGNWQYANGFNMGLTAAEVAIKKQPSAQPEIIHCGDCRYKDDGIDEEGIPFLKCLSGRSYGGTRINDFCSWAERRTDG